MNQLTNNDLKTIIQDLLENRLEDIQLLATSALFVKPLQETLEILGENIALEQTLPYTREIQNADALHDGLGRTIYHLCQAYLSNPLISLDDRIIIQEVQLNFITNLQELKESYADQTSRARIRRIKLAQIGEQIATIPYNKTRNLRDLINEYLAAGETIEALLQQRDRKVENNIRTERIKAINLLSNLRSILRVELQQRNDLPADLENRIFAFANQKTVVRNLELSNKISNQTPENTQDLKSTQISSEIMEEIENTENAIS